MQSSTVISGARAATRTLPWHPSHAQRNVLRVPMRVPTRPPVVFSHDEALAVIGKLEGE
jgi:hypothetical protein